MNLEDCLPAKLRGPETTITRIAAGMSGAGVYRVDANGGVYVLKIASDAEPETDWRRAVEIQRRAAEAGIAPLVLHVDEARRAVLTPFVVDRSFIAYFRDPATHGDALRKLGECVRKIHALAIPEGTPTRGAEIFLAELFGGLSGFAIPGFAREFVERVLRTKAPAASRAPVLSHNDLNPTNLIYDGSRIVLLDWAAASAMDPFYDLAVLALFLRLDRGGALRLLQAYDAALTELPARFVYMREVAAALAGTMQLHLARRAGHKGASGMETEDAVIPLGEFFARLQKGEFKLGTPEFHWAFGLALFRSELG